MVRVHTNVHARTQPRCNFLGLAEVEEEVVEEGRWDSFLTGQTRIPAAVQGCGGHAATEWTRERTRRCTDDMEANDGEGQGRLTKLKLFVIHEPDGGWSTSLKNRTRESFHSHKTDTSGCKVKSVYKQVFDQKLFLRGHQNKSYSMRFHSYI